MSLYAETPRPAPPSHRGPTARPLRRFHLFVRVDSSGRSGGGCGGCRRCRWRHSVHVLLLIVGGHRHGWSGPPRPHHQWSPHHPLHRRASFKGLLRVMVRSRLCHCRLLRGQSDCSGVIFLCNFFRYGCRVSRGGGGGGGGGRRCIVRASDKVVTSLKIV